jgi:hypothetical protein
MEICREIDFDTVNFNEVISFVVRWKFPQFVTSEMNVGISGVDGGALAELIRMRSLIKSHSLLNEVFLLKYNLTQ